MMPKTKDNKMDIKIAAYIASGLLTLSLANNAWMTYKISQLDNTIQKQMNGELSKTARILSETRDEINVVKSQMVSRKELEEQSSKIISNLDQRTQDAIYKYTKETGARVDSISQRVLGMEGRIKKGIGKIGRTVKEKTAPPPSWKGVDGLDITRCSDHPDKCTPFTFEWESPYQVNGKPLARFSSLNLWKGLGSIDLNLAFKVVAITYGEDQSRLGSGAVQNQGIHVLGGYVQEGNFVPIPGLESKLLQGDPNLDSKLIYVPKKDAQNSTLLKLFEPSLLVGSTYQANEFGLSIGASLLNFQKGQYRIGANGVITPSNVFLGAKATWHPYLLGKNLNLAPGLGWVAGSDGTNTWSLGVHFQVW